MKLSKLIILLLILASLGTIACYGQTDSGKICLTYSEFDFYAQKLVEYNGLKADTTIMSEQLHVNGQIISNKEKQLFNANLELLEKDKIIAVKAQDFDVLAKKYTKQEKRLKLAKKGTVIFGLTTCLFAGLFLLK